MKIFSCQKCSQTVLFENTHCENCHSALGFLPDQIELSALEGQGDTWHALADRSLPAKQWRYCENFQHNVCNWLIDEEDETFCIACQLNRHIPNLAKFEQLKAWQQLEFAKHRLVYSLLRLGLPVINKQDAPESGLSFDFISENDVVPDDAQSTTGHALGQVTINASEANSANREQMKADLNESYRTLIGHFRHEVGHYYWDQIIFPYPKVLRAYRRLFGDEREDYAEALERHYQSPKANWQNDYISVYASSHPWEDWAETWAHYLHIIDTLETATEFGINIQPRKAEFEHLAVKSDVNPYQDVHFDDILAQYLPLTFAVNSLNRCMGQPDLYPFIIVPTVRKKLNFIHQLIHKRKQVIKPRKHK